jgi:chromosomal replication initiator protein
MQTDTKQLWENALTAIELSISKANFSTWFKETRIVRYDEGVVVIGVPNQFAKEWLSQRFHQLILKTLRELADSVRSVEYIIAKDDRRKRAPESVRTRSDASELPLGDLYINRADNLNPRYTFDNFVVGPFNEFAFTAAQAVVKEPGIAYNPLFVYGDTGRGKTHLIQAVGNHLKKINPNRKVFYLTSEKFVVDYINSVQERSVNKFKDKYRQYDVLIMDDIQFFANKSSSQEELFHLFNALYDGNKQIVFSSDKHPNFIPDLEERLKSRFAAGMIVEIPEPDHESRMAILRNKAIHSGISLSEEIIEYLSLTIQGNIRELEGALNLVVCQAQLRDKEMTLADVKNIIKNIAKPKKTVSIKHVITKISEFYGIEESNIFEKTRRREVVRPRQLIMYVLREDFHVSYPTIGHTLGGRDHTTVIHSCEKVKNDLKVDAGLVQELSEIRTLLK